MHLLRIHHAALSLAGIISFSLFSSCGNAETFRIHAQYEPTSTIFISTGQTLSENQSRIENGALLVPSLLEESKATSEAIGIYRKIASTQRIQTFMISGNGIPSAFNSLLDRTENTISKWIFSSLSELLVWSLPDEIYSKHMYPEEQVFADKWIRDWGPVSTISNKTVHWLKQSSARGNIVVPALATKFGVNLIQPPWIPVQGNFMITKNGICALAVNDGVVPKEIIGVDAPSPEQIDIEAMRNLFGCKTVVQVPAIPLEPLGHIDLFAKFLNDNTVAVAAYSDNLVHVRIGQKVLRKRCLKYDSQGNCEVPASIEDLEGSLVSLEEKPILLNDFEKRIRTQFPRHSFEKKEMWGNLRNYKDFDLQEFTERVAKSFYSAGFHVVRIVNPRPVVTITRKEGFAPSQDEVAARIVFPTFLNSLISNRIIYAPVYEYWASGDDNMNAIAAYKSSGYQVYALPSDFLILQGGAVHCITREVH